MKKTIRRTILTVILLLGISLLILYLIPVSPPLKGIRFSRAVYDEHHRLLRLTLSSDDAYRLYTPLSKIAPELLEATLLEEDHYFRWHQGFNPIALIKAGWQTYVMKSRRIGASTITMQVARLRYHIHSKNVSGKLLQIIRALQLEMHFSKDELLEAYLNLAPYGNNIEGIGAASLIYFGKNANELTLPEALILCVIPQNPSQRIPSKKTLKQSRDKLFQRWVVAHPKDEDKQNIIDLPLQMQTIHQLPFFAPHFVNTVLTDKALTTNEITTTLDLRLQKSVERVMHQYLARKRNLGVNNAAILLIDTRDMGVKALVGSADFFNPSIAGQMNGAEIKRSPGSTLKPFIYALALDQGLIHPHTVLKDVPHSFGNYNPENFDYDFMGPIKANEALTLSRNIPAIFLASQLSHPNLYDLITSADIHYLKSEAHYGLALVLGGAELTMQDLTSLYAMLVNDGMWKPLRFTNDQAMSKGKQLLSPEASFLVLDMLKNSIPTSGFSRLNSKPAWKTGTSSGYRDAWTVGVVGPYVLTVWFGNFNNQSNPALVGKSIAAPLFFELIDALNKEVKISSVSKDPKQLHLERVAVCKASGLLPTRNCKDTELTWFIPGKSPIKTDTIFREIAIDKTTGLRTCQINQNTQFEVYEFWPSDLLKIFKEAGMQRRTPPPFDSSCSLSRGDGMGPQITSPKPQLSYVVRASAANVTQIPLTAIADADVSTLYWFVNETFLGKIDRDQVFLWNAKPGQFVIRVVDDHGRAHAQEIVVRVEI